MKKLTEMSEQEIRQAVADKYGEVAKKLGKSLDFPTGYEFAIEVGYPESLLNSIPKRSVDAFAGANNTMLFAPLQVGNTVLDIGCGAGMDSFIAARFVGPSGKVYGIDASDDMIELAQRCLSETELTQVQFVHGYAEKMPFDEHMFDIVVSNGIFNLSPNKRKVAKEILRVLKPEGTLTLSEIVLKEEIPLDQRDDLSAWFR